MNLLYIFFVFCNFLFGCTWLSAQTNFFEIQEVQASSKPIDGFVSTLNVSSIPNTLCDSSILKEEHRISIVFVHIGEELPEYLSIAIEQAILFNKSANIYIIGNKEAIKKSSFFLKSDVCCIFCEDLEKSKSHQIFLASSGLDKESFQGFWKFTSERFFYLEEFMRTYEIESIFHLENDVMLYVDLAELMPIFRRGYPNVIAATFDSDTRCVPGFMYIASIEPLSELVKLMALRAQLGKNDMEMLQEFKDLYYKIYIDHLPIVNPQYAQDYGLKNTLNHIAKSPEMYFQFFEEFESIFDAAAIGQYLGGISPRNGEALVGFINETCFFNPAHFSFIWKKDFENRWVPHLSYKETEYRINNLHVHSKNLREFYSEK
jgi:hypothetical protein